MPPIGFAAHAADHPYDATGLGKPQGHVRESIVRGYQLADPFGSDPNILFSNDNVHDDNIPFFEGRTGRKHYLDMRCVTSSECLPAFASHTHT